MVTSAAPSPAAPLRFTFAISSYDHVRAVVDGRIPIEGAEPLFIQLPIPEMFRRFATTQDWDVSEFSFGQYGTRRAAGDDRIVGIPVFPSRMYRHTSIYVRAERIRAPVDLIGSRIGIPAWANSAGVWARGMLADMHGIRASDVTWYQGGVDRPGRSEVLTYPHLPDDVRIIPVTDRGIEEMLWAGDLEAIIIPAPPPSIETSAASGGLIRRLYDDPRTAERLYREKTGCLPIMHLLGISRALFDSDPSIAGRIYAAMELARREYFARLEDTAASLVPIPWVADHLESLGAVFGADPWPYGVEANRTTLETYLRYLRAQGLAAGQVEPGDLFPEWEALQSVPTIS
jgi:4,5-dihydroxyphthalate decarboxylase